MALVRVERLVEPAFSGPHECPHFGYGFCKGGLGIQADRTVTHVAYHDGCLDLEVRSEFCQELRIAIGVLLYGKCRRLFADIGPQLHGLAERVDRGVGDLACIKNEPVEDHRVGKDVSHPGYDDLPRLCLVEDRLADLAGPDRVAPVIGGLFVDTDRVARAEGKAAVAGHAVPGIDIDFGVLFTEHAIRAVLDTATAVHATLGVKLDLEAERDAADAHATTLPITGSPAFGMLTSPISGTILRIAASSLEM